MSTRALAALGAIALVAVIAVVVLVSGDDDGSAEPSETDGAFIAEMVPHHEAAIEMASVAVERAQHPEVKQLAQAIIETQGEEIDELSSIHERLFDEPVAAADHGSLGLSEAEMGGHGDAFMLAEAEEFDREFIDMMVPHHQGAIRMARIELDEGEDEALRHLAEEIIAAQSREIEEMNRWRTDWYGEPSPAGGMPAEEEDEEEAPSHEAMDH
jgi:uncharacterized protein (DUF305 family)